MENSGPPVYLTIREASRLLGWTYNRTYRMLYESNLLVMRCGKPLLPLQRLKEQLPEVWEHWRTELV